MDISLIDANIFLELELGQSRSSECKEFLSQVARGRIKAVTTDFILDSVALVMEDKRSPPKDIRKFFVSLALYNGLSIYSLDLKDRIVAAEEMIRERLDFDDSTSIAAMKRLKIKDIVSFDKDFDKAKALTRVEPRDILR
ncbi:MAG: type II toxin-antitoxin system VapC family toxin [Thaumarchaeota archaeon]|nr:type II toxin-antitoxin system VapC family toxin [Nitrososphaerota archaeon]